MKQCRSVWLCCLVGVAVYIAGSLPAVAAPIVPSDLSYQGSFKLKSVYGDYSWGSLLYMNEGGQDRLYYSSFNYLRKSSVPALVTPDATWSNLNTGTDLVTSTINKPQQVAGMVLRDDGMIYGIGRNMSATNGWYRIAPSLDQATCVAIGQDTNTNGMGGATRVPAGFVASLETAKGVAAGTYSGYDTLIFNNQNGAPRMTLSAPSLPLVSDKVASTGVFFIQAGTPAVWHWDSQEILWMADPQAPTDWTKARLLVTSKDTTTGGIFAIDFYDPQAILAAAAWNGKPQNAVNPATVMPLHLDLTPYIKGPYQVNGLAYDPATGRLFVGESGNYNSTSYVHVFQVAGVPEPATLCLLVVSGLFLARRRTA